MPTPNAQQGFSLLEALVTLLVLSIGLLGIAGMQSISLRSTYNAGLITLANVQANNMIERMRANMSAVGAGAYDNINGSEANPGCWPTCSANQQAQLDAYEWSAQNKTVLKDNGSGSVSNTVSTNGDGTFTITINWNELGDAGSSSGAEAMQYVLRFQP